MMFCLSLKIWAKILENLRGKYSQKLSVHAKQSDTDALKFDLKRAT